MPLYLEEIKGFSSKAWEKGQIFRLEIRAI
jgi:hypothetical protein